MNCKTILRRKKYKLSTKSACFLNTKFYKFVNQQNETYSAEIA